MNRSITMFVLVAGFVLFSRAVSAQAPPHSESDELVDLNWQTPMWQPQLDGTLGWLPPRPAVAGYEHFLLSELKEDLSGEELNNYSPRTDNAGNLIITFGSGSPVRVIAAPVDEPGYVVSGITEDGYLRVQRLPQAVPNPVFDALNFGQPVAITKRDGKKVSGVFAGLSVHLQPGRVSPPKMDHPDQMYVDIGAKNAEEVRAAGVDILDPIVFDEKPRFGVVRRGGVAFGKAQGDRFGMAALLELLPKMRLSKTLANQGTTIIAFVTQSWTGGRGLNRLLDEFHADEMVYVSRISEPAAEEGSGKKNLGEGVLLGVNDSKAELSGIAARFRDVAAERKIPVKVVSAAKPRIASYAKGSEFPGQFVQLGVSTRWPATPAEALSYEDVLHLEQLLQGYLRLYAANNEGVPGGEPWRDPRDPAKFADLVTAYGASGQEDAVRRTVVWALPEWAKQKSTIDAAGNLVLHVGDQKNDGKTPRIAFVAHMDEIGYEVKKIEDDGRLQVEVLGGGYPQYFLGHAVFVHTKGRNGDVDGVLELPNGWNKPGYEFPTSSRSMDEPAHVYVGTRGREDTKRLGIEVGDFVTIPKQYRPLLGTRANARSFDDRVGCWALISAVRAIGPEVPGRDVTFVWSTEEEVGLKGAAAFSEQAAKEGKTPDFVFAIDTFVSADSPLESKHFGDAEIGNGFVIRAVDNSNVVPLEYVDRVVKLAKENNIPVQYGVTGGGNDGAVFTRFGSVDVALGWPLRYSHSPAEVIDTKDLDALAKIVAVIAKQW